MAVRGKRKEQHSHAGAEAALTESDEQQRLFVTANSDHYRTELALRESEAWLRGQKEAFQAAMDGQPLSVSLGVLVQTVLAQTKGKARAAFYIISPGDKDLHHVVGMSAAYTRDISGFRVGPESFVCRLAMHTGEPVITPDVEEEPRWVPWRSLARKHGYRACWSFPVRTVGGPVVGTFVQYFTQPRKPTPRALKLAGIIGHAAAIIISRDTESTERAQAEAALRESEQKLRLLVKQKDEFIGVASHELKTPVTSMKAYAEIVQERLAELGDERDSELLARLNAQIDRLTLLINDLLDTTKISEGQLKLTFEPLNINDLLEEKIGEIKRTTTHRFELQAAELPPVMADSERIGQVVTNLLANAVKFSPKETTITIESRDVGNGVRIRVRDEGCGISAADQHKIFDRFYRVTADNMDTFPGMGLGLYISAQIIHRHGGTIDVKSKLGEGSVFSFTLPYSNTSL